MDTAATWPAMLRWASRPTPLPRSPPPVRQVNLKLLSRVFPEPSRSRTFLANFIDFSISLRFTLKREILKKRTDRSTWLLNDWNIIPITISIDEK